MATLVQNLKTEKQLRNWRMPCI